MNYIKKFILRGLFGITLGVFINQFVYLILALQGDVVSISSDIIITQFVISSVVGFYSAGISVVFNVEEWSILRQTVTHFIAMLVYFPIAIYAGWMPTTLLGRALFILNYIVVYVVIWLSVRRYWANKAKELNAELHKRRMNNV